MTIVIDANIAISWFTPSPPKIAQDALVALSEDACIVPALWRWEVEDVLRRLDRTGNLMISPEHALHELRELPIVVDHVTALFGEEMTLAQQYHLTVFDAAYLELALRRGIPLATHDKKLAAAAKAAGVTL